jgi:basic membrane protein A and related proteins
VNRSWLARGLLSVVLGVALIPALFGRASLPVSAGSAPVRSAFLYLGPIDTSTWSYAHDQGRMAAAQALGVDTQPVQGVTADNADQIIRQQIAQGYNVIFATSFDFAPAVLRIASEFPNVIFEQATGVETAPNVSTYDGRIYQSWYLAGMAAGAMSGTNTIGYVAPVPIPEVVRDMNAFTLGARAVNPNVQVYPSWVGAFLDPPKERDAAESLLGMGVDVLARESDSIQPEQAAAERGVWAIGYNSVPPGDDTPNLLTAPIWHWEVFYEKELTDLMQGKWTNAPVWWGTPEGLVDIAPLNPAIPAATRAQISAKQADIRSQAFDVFAGPITDNTGQLRVPAGSSLTDAQLLSIDWLVDGVVGTLPQP